MPFRDETKINPLVATSPRCPRCRGDMVEREAQRGPKAGQAFWGCLDYPHCRGTLPLAIGNAMLEQARAEALAQKSAKAEAEARKDENDFGFINFMDLD